MYQKNDILFHVSLITHIDLQKLSWFQKISGKHVSMRIPYEMWTWVSSSLIPPPSICTKVSHWSSKERMWEHILSQKLYRWKGPSRSPDLIFIRRNSRLEASSFDFGANILFSSYKMEDFYSLSSLRDSLLRPWTLSAGWKDAFPNRWVGETSVGMRVLLLQLSRPTCWLSQAGLDGWTAVHN